MPPKHLEGYDWLAALEAWRAAGGTDADKTLERWWELSPGRLDGRVFRVRLEYPGANNWVCSIAKLATSVEEAVWLALAEWGRTPTCGRRPV